MSTETKIPASDAIDSSTLLACPFCGSEAEYRLDEQWQDRHVIECTYCGCDRRSEYGRDAVTQKWNERAG
jgi:Lar family restriction alleviation protein